MSEPTGDGTSKGERTRQRILAAALELFREQGYEATTMRLVAERAEVSLGNAYYYFASKELLLQEFYRDVHTAHLAAVQPVLATTRSLEDRLRGVQHAWIDVIAPYHRFAVLMFQTAADPKSPMNPFHEQNASWRREGEAVFAEVLTGAKVRVPKDLAQQLPGLLWTYRMGLLLFWMYDESPGHRRTRALVDRTSDLVCRCIRLASNPLLRPLRKSILATLREVQAGGLSAPAADRGQ